MFRCTRLLAVLLLATACASAPSTPASVDHDNGSLQASHNPPTIDPALHGADLDKRLRRPRPAMGGIYRSEIEEATHGYQPAYVLRELSPVAFTPRGRFQGWTIGRLFPSTPGLCGADCDLKVGDVVLSVNGSRLERPEQFSTILEALKNADSLDLRIVRDGEMLEFNYPIVPDERAG